LLEGIEIDATQTNYDGLINFVPEDQRKELRRRIDFLVEQGWTSIGLWTDEEPADLTDLCGVSLGEKFVKFYIGVFL